MKQINIFLSFVLKEGRHIVRDWRTLLILISMPIVMMLLFGFAISTEIKNVRVVLVSSSMDNQTQRIANRLNVSSYFDITSVVHTPKEAEELIEKAQADMAIVFSENFANHLIDGTSHIQIIVDCTDPNMAIQQYNYVKQIIASELSQGKIPQNKATIKLLYNERLQSAYNFVPGVMGMILMIICAMMTSISIVREKERGTMEVLLVSPIRPIWMMIAKMVPYLILAFIDLVFILLLSFYVLHVPIVGNIFSLFLVSTLFIIVALSLGLLISVLTKTQVAAMLASGMILLMPSILLSGMIYPIESMPAALRCVAYLIPASWFISACRKLMIMGVSLPMVRCEICILTLMATCFLSLSLAKFKTRLE